VKEDALSSSVEVAGAVLVTQQTLRRPERGEVLDALDQRWAQRLAALGRVCVPVPSELGAALALAGALPRPLLIFSGGNDVRGYGDNPAPLRDAVELALLEWARLHDAPVIGVCRGAQLMATALGASLELVEGHAGTQHELVANAALGLARVNSYHRWTVRRSSLPAALQIAAASDDGAIEAFVHARWPWLGVMWHPEREPCSLAAVLAWSEALCAR
jgi:N5-(cytidine 5'-diphosphoramidyl)-L-glutamine hydrolase